MRFNTVKALALVCLLALSPNTANAAARDQEELIPMKAVQLREQANPLTELFRVERKESIRKDAEGKYEEAVRLFEAAHVEVDKKLKAAKEGVKNKESKKRELRLAQAKGLLLYHVAWTKVFWSRLYPDKMGDDQKGMKTLKEGNEILNELRKGLRDAANVQSNEELEAIIPPQFMWAKAMVWWGRGQYPKAMNQFDKAIERLSKDSKAAPVHRAVYYFKAECQLDWILHSNGRLEDLTTTLAKFQKLKGVKSSHFHNLSKLLGAAGLLSKGGVTNKKEALKIAYEISKDPDNQIVQAWANKVMGQAMQGMDIKDQPPEMIATAAQGAMTEGEFKKAAELFQVVLQKLSQVKPVTQELKTRIAQHTYNIAAAQFQAKNYQVASEYLAEYVKKFPKGEKIAAAVKYRYVALRSLYRARSTDGADVALLDEFKKAATFFIEKYPEDSRVDEARYFLADALQKAEMTSDALELFEGVSDSSPYYINANSKLGEIYWKRFQTEFGEISEPTKKQQEERTRTLNKGLAAYGKVARTIVSDPNKSADANQRKTAAYAMMRVVDIEIALPDIEKARTHIAYIQKTFAEQAEILGHINGLEMDILLRSTPPDYAAGEARVKKLVEENGEEHQTTKNARIKMMRAYEKAAEKTFTEDEKKAWHEKMKRHQVVILDLMPKESPKDWEHLGDLWWTDFGDVEKGEENYRRALLDVKEKKGFELAKKQGDPDWKKLTKRCRYKIGMILMERSDTDATARNKIKGWYEKLITDYGEDIRTLEGLAKAYEWSDQQEKALETLKKIARYHKKRSLGWWKLKYETARIRSRMSSEDLMKHSYALIKQSWDFYPKDLFGAKYEKGADLQDKTVALLKKLQSKTGDAQLKEDIGKLLLSIAAGPKEEVEIEIPEETPEETPKNGEPEEGKKNN